MCRKLVLLVSLILVLAACGAVQADFAGWEAAISDANPLNWYRFDDTGDECLDSGSEGLNGTYDSVLLGQEGLFEPGTAVEFERIGANRVNFTGATDLPGPWTVEYIVKTTKEPAANDSQALHDGDTTSVRLAGWSALGEVGFTLYGVADYQFTPAAELTLNDLVIQPDVWMHLVWRNNGSGTQMFFDGKLAGTAADMIDLPRLRIGGRGAGPADHLQGVLDEAVVFDRALTDAEIFAHASATFPLKATNPEPEDGAITADTWVSLGWIAGSTAVSHDMYFSDNFDAVNDGTGDAFRGNLTTIYFVAGFPGFPYPDGLVNGTTYYWRIDEVEADGVTKHTGKIWSFTVPPKTAYYPEPAEGAESVDLNVVLNWTPGFGAKLHYIVFGEDFDEVSNAAAGTPNGPPNYTPGLLKMAKTYYWRVDEFDGAETYKGEVWSFTTLGAASSPNPANGAVDVKPSVILSWDAGAVAASHEVYFGTDADAVKNATKSSPEYKGPIALGEESYDPGKLMLNTAYYWRVDEVNSASTDSPWAGNVWSFTTGDFFSIDDFEGYDAGDNQIWFAWHDGLGAGAPGTAGYVPGNGTGSAVGDETTLSYTEETIVHGGGQSMPISYDNNKQGYSNYSEVEYTLTDQRDWTEEGVTELSLWFYGDSANSAESLYVAVSNSAGTSAVVVNDDPAAATIDSWTQWVIPLQAFADQGINLSNVDKIAIGLGTRGNIATPGGSGKIYIDDVRLNQPGEVAE